MLQWLGAFRDQPEYMGYDKGHYIAHCNDGQVDQNLYPQLRELNRGISQQGKLYRSMERYLATKPRHLLFCAAIIQRPDLDTRSDRFWHFYKRKRPAAKPVR
jgi:hypothetical protein